MLVLEAKALMACGLLMVLYMPLALLFYMANRELMDWFVP